MWTSLATSGWTRAALLVTLLVTPAAPASGAGISVTSGALDMRFSSGRLLVGGDHGFTLDSSVASIDGVFAPATCNASPRACVPGATVDLTALWVGSDVRGTASVDGRVFTGLGSMSGTSHASIHFAGSAVLPPAGGSAVTVRAPFTFDGVFDHLDVDTAPVQDTLSGSGTASLSLVPSALVPGGWSIARVVYAFSGRGPDGWVTTDVGNVGLPGETTAVSATQIMVSGAGDDIWGARDAFHFVFQAAPGDVDVITRVDSVSASNAFAKAGVMMRAGVAPSAAHVVLDAKPGGGLEFMTRSADGSSTQYLAGTAASFPVWLKLSHLGDRVAAAYSSDGVRWTALGATSLASVAYAGIVTTSHSMAAINEARFSNSSIQQPVAPASVAWKQADVGLVGSPGDSVLQPGRMAVSGAGADIWGRADAFHFVYQPLAGDSSLVARVSSLENSNTFAKAGLMFRNGIGADAAHVILDVRPNGEVEFMSRAANAGETSYLGGRQTGIAVWLMLVRRGNTFLGYSSADGGNWSPIGSTVTMLDGAAFAGLVVTSHDAGSVTHAEFESIAVTEGVPVTP
ncbi:MAG TPA: hypothetical protein VM032_15150 [Vicinamibacterales bacterium]|nr:hypothetical protein [Vicinamibacterales bacterium]